ncbi:MAG: hypothetical protein KY433_11755, partial [Actinobacteria bacterium]|nr:hypothetical protein [Actinomycetota bacterium]
TRRRVHDVRAIGRALPCPRARALARRWAGSERRARVDRYRAAVRDFGGLRRVVLTRGDGKSRQLVAFLHRAR